jgi:hypothetical protein
MSAVANEHAIRISGQCYFSIGKSDINSIFAISLMMSVLIKIIKG